MQPPGDKHTRHAGKTDPAAATADTGSPYPPTVAARVDTAAAIVAEIQTESASLNPNDPDDMDRWDRRRSIIQAIAWALGNATESPLGSVTAAIVPTESELRSEYRQAEHAIYHQRSTGIPYSRAAGIEHTLLWLLGESDESPWDLRQSP